MNNTMLTATQAQAIVNNYNYQNSLQITNAADIYTCCVEINSLITTAATNGLTYLAPYQTDNFNFGQIPVNQQANAMQIINASFSAIGYQIGYFNQQNPLSSDGKVYVYGW